jgi:peptidoglycan hydrolase FlgJ
MTIHATKEALGPADFGASRILRSPAPSPQPPAPSAIRRGGHDSPELHEAFSDFVGQTFFGELVKQMRATVKKPAYFHGGMGEEIFQTQLDQILVERISDVSAKTFSDPMYQLMMAPRS